MPNIVLFNGNTPSLQAVALQGIHLNWSESHFLRGLVELTLGNHVHDMRPTFIHFMRILRDCPELRYLVLRGSGPAGTPHNWLNSLPVEESRDPDMVDVLYFASIYFIPSSATTVCLNALRSLHLALLDQDYASALVQCFALPKLCHLALAIDSEGEDCSPFLQILVQPSRATGISFLQGLTTLELWDINCEDERVIWEVYSSMPYLEILIIDFGDVYEVWYSVLAILQPGEGTSNDTMQIILLPRLRSFTATQLDGSLVRILVEARKAMGVPLKQVCLLGTYEMNGADELWLLRNVEDFQYTPDSDSEEDGNWEER